MVEQHSMVNSLYGFKQKVYEKHDGYINAASTGTYTFDASIRVLLGSLICGHTMHLISNDLKMQGKSVFNYISEKNIHVIDCTPTLLNIWLSDDLTKVPNHKLKTILTAGEALTTNLLQRLYALSHLENIQVINLYGPTETTMITALFPLNKTLFQNLTTIPVGYVLPNYQVYIVDKELKPVPIGVKGEICISGEGVSRGYLNNPTLTAEKFVANPFITNQRMYRTGDTGKWKTDGSIEFGGRLDFQLKVRGHRIETGEIKQALLTHEAVQDCVVVGQNIGESQELVAYLIAKPNATLPNRTALHHFLTDKLPKYMLPAYFITLEKMPLTRSGKINRKALPKLNNTFLSTGEIQKNVIPTNTMERELMNIWQVVLGKENIGVQDDFFSLGGHSLRLIQLKHKIKQELDLDVKLPSLFKNTTIKQQAAHFSVIDNNSTNAEGLRFNSENLTTIFAFPPLFGLAMVYQQLAEKLLDVSIYSFDFIEEKNRVEQYYQQIKQTQAEGPYILFGYSAGGKLAFETAAYMEAKGEAVAGVILGDSTRETEVEHFDAVQHIEEYLGLIANGIKQNSNPNDWELRLLDLLENDATFKEQTKNRLIAYTEFHALTEIKQPLQADIYFLEAEEKTVYEGYTQHKDWETYTVNNYQAYTAKGKHMDFLSPSFIEHNAAQITNAIKTIREDRYGHQQLIAANQQLNLIYLKLIQQKMKLEQSKHLETNFV